MHISILKCYSFRSVSLLWLSLHLLLQKLTNYNNMILWSIFFLLEENGTPLHLNQWILTRFHIEKYLLSELVGHSMSKPKEIGRFHLTLFKFGLKGYLSCKRPFYATHPPIQKWPYLANPWVKYVDIGVYEKLFT